MKKKTPNGIHLSTDSANTKANSQKQSNKFKPK